METTLHYNNTVELCYDDRKHHYTVDGETYDGVTSILNVIAKPALVYWSANCAAEFIEKNLPVNLPVDEVQKKNLVEGAKKAHRNKLQEAADYGTIVHDWIENYIKHKNPAMPTNSVLKKAVNQFLEWAAKNELVFLSSEKKIISKKYKFCGTCDFVAQVKGKTVLGDIKTSSGIYDTMWLQTAAYKGAYLEEFPNEKINHTLILRCGKKGDFEVKELNDFEQNYNAFIAALILHRRIKEMKKLKYINS